MDEQRPSWFDPNLEEGVEPITREAIAWCNLLRSDQASDRDRVAFRAWLRRDPRHAEAFAQIEQLWSGLSGLPEARRRRRSVTRRNFGVGALMLAAAGGVWGASRYHLFADHRTGTGERRSVTLSDGSQVDLSASTALSTDLAGTDRRITLHYGEAFFEVAPQSGRPFSVRTSRGRITALGTAFAAADDAERVVVTVTQHAVRIDAGTQSLRMEAGLQASLGADGLSAPQAVDPADVLAWREGRLVFVNARLDHVLDVLNRWRPGRLVMMSRTLGTYPVTLIVNLQDVARTLRQLEDALPIVMTDVTPMLTLVHAR